MMPEKLQFRSLSSITHISNNLPLFFSSHEFFVLKVSYCDQSMPVVRRVSYASSTVSFKWQLLLYHWTNFNQYSQESLYKNS